MDDVSVHTHFVVVPEMPAEEYVATRVAAGPEI
jgi:hypothetical protein